MKIEVTKRKKFFVKLKKRFFAKTIIPSESTFSDLQNDTKIKALAAVVPEIMTFLLPEVCHLNRNNLAWVLKIYCFHLLTQ